MANLPFVVLVLAFTGLSSSFRLCRDDSALAAQLGKKGGIFDMLQPSSFEDRMATRRDGAAGDSGSSDSDSDSDDGWDDIFSQV
jgi:hypothetical protein